MKKLVFQFLYWTGAVRLAAWVKRRHVVVLCYHGVTQRATRDPDDRFGLQVRENRFRCHLDYLNRRYRVISFRDYLRARASQAELPDYSAIITFDDGHRNFYTAAAPLLEHHQMPAVMFLISDRVAASDSQSQTWYDNDDHDYLSWNEVRKLISRGFEFGSHTCSHQKLPQISTQDLEHELQDSKTAIEEHVKTEGLPLAYPYGMTTDDIAGRAAALGYSCAFTTKTGFNNHTTELFKLHRTLIGDDDDIPAFAARLAGLTR